jgi:hypothetical protein
MFSGLISFGFNHANRDTFDKKRVVHLSAVRRELAHGNTKSGCKVQVFHILHRPAGLSQLLIYLQTGSFFRSHIGISLIYTYLSAH